jgi:beta-galactosidase/beta-glucuronidase
MKHTRCYIHGYPRPQFVRGDWISLDGKWDFAFDSENTGERRGYGGGFKKECDITVPYSYECEASGIGKTDMVENVWYARSFTLSAAKVKKRTVLHFDGVDYTAKVWINGIFVGMHSGGYVRFSFDISDFVQAGENLLVVKAEDGFDLTQPRGKQRWKNDNFGCWYEQTTGIWKTVWLDFTDRDAWIESVKITPRGDSHSLELEFETAFRGSGYELETTVSFSGKTLKKLSSSLETAVLQVKIFLESPELDNQIRLWSPDDPALYDLEFVLTKDGAVVDRAGSYFGLRDFRPTGTAMLLTGFPYYQKLLLYQGYWDKTLLTPPDSESIVKDIEIIKELGYNGVRVHQKTEDERFLYFADVMGLLVWCEMPSAYAFCERAKERVTSEWMQIVKQSYNHPSVITWVIFNESWGIYDVAHNGEQQAFTEALYKLTKALDSTRPVISNDGWEHTLSDILTIHTYEQDAKALSGHYSDLTDLINNRVTALPQRLPYAHGYPHGDLPVIFSEFGGCAFADDIKGANWGYGQAVSSSEDFYERFGALVDAVKSFPYCSGYCYTQFTDVRQEKNGLLTADRKYKIDPARIRAINDRRIQKTRRVPE